VDGIVVHKEGRQSLENGGLGCLVVHQGMHLEAAIFQAKPDVLGELPCVPQTGVIDGLQALHRALE
jgi:hypothetical protein